MCARSHDTWRLHGRDAAQPAANRRRGTSIAAFLGETERGPSYPTLVTSDADYARWFGGVFLPDRYLPYAVRGFFENGCKRLYVARIVGAGATAATQTIGGLTVRASGPGAWGNRVWVRVMPGVANGGDGTAAGFALRLAYWSEPDPPNFDPFDASSPRFREDTGRSSWFAVGRRCIDRQTYG
jgi:uncharacterized protein